VTWETKFWEGAVASTVASFQRAWTASVRRRTTSWRIRDSSKQMRRGYKKDKSPGEVGFDKIRIGSGNLEKGLTFRLGEPLDEIQKLHVQATKGGLILCPNRNPGKFVLLAVALAICIEMHIRHES